MTKTVLTVDAVTYESVLVPIVLVQERENIFTKPSPFYFTEVHETSKSTKNVINVAKHVTYGKKMFSSGYNMMLCDGN